MTPEPISQVAAGVTPGPISQVAAGVTPGPISQVAAGVTPGPISQVGWPSITIVASSVQLACMIVGSSHSIYCVNKSKHVIAAAQWIYMYNYGNTHGDGTIRSNLMQKMYNF